MCEIIYTREAIPYPGAFFTHFLNLNSYLFIFSYLHDPVRLSLCQCMCSFLCMCTPDCMHLCVMQRTTQTPDLEALEEEMDEEEVTQEGAQNRSLLNFSSSGKKATKVPEQFKLVQGEPLEARFEFIAVRKTWISDHLPPAMLKALLSAETGEPVHDE
jgi:hypothetical protein